MNNTPEFNIEYNGKDIYVCCDDLRVAKRGHPNTPKAGTWICLIPGYIVTSPADHATISVEVDPHIIRNQ
jgi:hypothetical protein